MRTGWRERHNKIFCLLKKRVDHRQFDVEEKEFYDMQSLPSRVGYISDKEDENYVQSSKVDDRIEEVEENLVEVEENDNEVDMDVDLANASVINTSLNRSGFIRVSTEEQETRIEDYHDKRFVLVNS